MMDIFILIGFLWVCGWLYACGVHESSLDIVRKNGTKEQNQRIDRSVWLQYVILFFGWPHYLGYGNAN